MTRARFAAPPVAATIALGVLIALTHVMVSAAGGQGPSIPPDLRDRAAREGHVKVLAQLRLATGPHVPEGQLVQRRTPCGRSAQLSPMPPSVSRAGFRQRRALRSAFRDPALRGARGERRRARRARARLRRNTASVVPDELVRPVLADSVPLLYRLTRPGSPVRRQWDRDCRPRQRRRQPASVPERQGRRPGVLLEHGRRREPVILSERADDASEPPIPVYPAVCITSGYDRMPDTLGSQPCFVRTDQRI